jgi:MFS family permease
LIGGLITTTVSWRASFILQAIVVAAIYFLARRIVDPIPADPRRPFDVTGAVLSAVAMTFIVVGILQAQKSLLLMVVLLLVGAGLFAWYFLHARAYQRAGKAPLISTNLFGNRTSNLGLVTQNIQWLMLLGMSFTVSVYLQVVRGYNAIQTGLVFTAATVGILVSSALAQRWAKRYAQRSLIVTGFIVTLGGIALLLWLVSAWSSVLAFLPGLLLIGLGVGGMLTPSVNVVQSSFPERLQGEISGLSRSVSNLGSSLGTAIAGTILVSDLAHGDRAYALAIIALAVAGLIGLGAGLLLPSNRGHAEIA